MQFLRYPGGKSKQLSFIIKYLPKKQDIKGNYFEPFIGGGSVFLYLKPDNAIISDLNKELIELYKGIKNYPHKVWDTFKKFPVGKKAYYDIRDMTFTLHPLYFRAARTLYLNRTCFKGMWRHNQKKDFNVGYGGEDRRWVITHQNIIELSRIFRAATIKKSDFEKILNNVRENDFIFLDPPYKPGEMEMKTAHYINGRFSFDDQIRLAEKLKQISSNHGIKWLMTNSSHPEICKLYKDFRIKHMPNSKSEKLGVLTQANSEVLISNY